MKTIIPKSGYSWNPLLDYPPTYACFCGSGTAFRSCCELKVKTTCSAVKTEVAEKIKEYVEMVKKRGAGPPAKKIIPSNEVAMTVEAKRGKE